MVNINKNFINDEYVNSPLHQSTLYSPKNKSPNELDPKINPIHINNLKQNHLNNDIDYNINCKRKNILFSNNDSRNNEFISEVLLNNNNLNIEINNQESSLEIHHEYKLHSPTIEYKRVDSSESYSDDDNRSNCTLTNESEKELTDQSSLIEDNTLILNNVIDTNVYESSNSNIYKTWDSEHSHILTF